ncbi:MAG: hypothetical protein LAP61_20305 [Acidobacteriia bacterium]|nr:hypothetical protein [Terriglobia bacterium]
MCGRRFLVLTVFTWLVFGQAKGQGVTLALGAVTGSPGSIVNVAISLASTSGAQPSALRWTLDYSAADVAGITWTIGAAGAAAAKSISCSGNSCVLYGLNANMIPDGVVAVASVLIAPTTVATSISTQISEVWAASGVGDLIRSVGSVSQISIIHAVIPSLSGLVCTPSSILAPGSAGCVVSLTAPALMPGLVVSLSSSSGAAVVPSSLTVPAGQTSAGFAVTVPSASADQTANVTVTAGLLTSTQTLSIVSPAQVSTVACTPTSLASGASSTCTATLNKATPAGTTMTLSSNASALTIPSTLPVSSGATSVQFTVTAGAILSDQSANIVASVSGSTGATFITLLDSQHVAFVTGYSQTANQLRNDFGGWVGMQFTVGSSSLNVASIGRLCLTGNSLVHAVKLVNAGTGSDVPGGSVMVNMSGCMPGQFQYAVLPNPLTLQAGVSYDLASQESSGGDRWYDFGSIFTTTAATGNSRTYSYDGSYWYNVAAPNNSYGPSNIRYTVASRSMIPVTVTTNPPGVPFNVDGTAYTSLQAFSWASGSSHTITTSSPQAGQTGVRYVWSSWTDGGALSHTVNPTTATTITANFTTQYLLTTNAAPAGSGSVTANPPSATGYYDSGTAVQLTAVPAGGSNLANWSGDLGGSANPQTVQMSAPRTVAANFTPPAGNLSTFVTGYASSSPILRSDFGGWVGMKITVGSNALTVSSLGRACVAGNYQTHTAKLVAVSNSADVPGGSVLLNLSGCNSGQFVYSFLATPVTLQAGASYYLVTQEFVGGDQWYDHGDVSTTSVAGVNNATYSQDGVSWVATSGANTSYVPPSFQYSSQSSTAPPTSNPAFITSYAQGGPSLRNDFSGWVGTKFTVGGGSLSVTALGRVCVTGNSSSHTVKLVNAGTGMNLPSGSAVVNMSGCTPGQFQYAGLSNPPTLQAGASYYLASQESAGGDQWYDSGTVSTTSVAAVNNPIYSYDGSAWNGLAVPNMSYGPPNFQYAAGSSDPSVPAAPFVTGYNLSSQPLRNNFSGWVGMAFTVAGTPLTVTSLGRICVAGNSAAHTVKLVSADSGADVAGGSLALNMSGCSPGQFQYANLSSPVTLPVGGRYFIVSQESFGGDQWYDWGSISTISIAAVTSAVYSDGSSWIPIGGPNNAYVPLNFK